MCIRDRPEPVSPVAAPASSAEHVTAPAGKLAPVTVTAVPALPLFGVSLVVTGSFGRASTATEPRVALGRGAGVQVVVKTEPLRSASVTARSSLTSTLVPSVPSGILMVPENALGSSGVPATTLTVSGGLVTTWVVAPTFRVILVVFTVVTEKPGISGLAPGSIVRGTTSPALAVSGRVIV